MNIDDRPYVRLMPQRRSQDQTDTGNDADAASTITRRQMLQAAGGLAAVSMLGAARDVPAALGSTDPTTLTFWVISPFTSSPHDAIFKSAHSYARATKNVTVTVQSLSPDSF